LPEICPKLRSQCVRRNLNLGNFLQVHHVMCYLTYCGHFDEDETKSNSFNKIKKTFKINAMES